MLGRMERKIRSFLLIRIIIIIMFMFVIIIIVTIVVVIIIIIIIIITKAITSATHQYYNHNIILCTILNVYMQTSMCRRW